MELVFAVLGAGPIGYFTATRRKGLVTYLIAWAVVFPIQTVVVIFVVGNGTGDMEPLYFVFNAVILAAGLCLNRLGSLLRERHAAKQTVAAETA